MRTTYPGTPKQHGFTLIELMVVIAIIGILAALAVAAYQLYTVRAQGAEALSLMNGVKSAVAENYHSNAVCPDNLRTDHFGIAVHSQINGRYVASVRVSPVGAACDVTATFRAAGVAVPLQGKTLSLQMTSLSGVEHWRCFSNDVNRIYLPASCR